jgi:excisionase family DNA binding protein
MNDSAAVLPALLSADEAASWLGLSRSSVFRLVRQGDLRAVRPLRELRFRQADLAAFVAGLEPAETEAAGSVGR